MGWLSAWDKAPTAASRGVRTSGAPGTVGAPRHDAAISRGEPSPRRAGPAGVGGTPVQDDADRAGWIESSASLAAGLVVVETADLTPWLLARRLHRCPG